ncbi:MAG: DinB family protein [Vicinamibacterales bacterium]
MITRPFSVVLLALAVAVPALAQQGAAQGPPTVTGFLRNLYNGNKNSVLRVAQRMPEEFYGLRPGTQTEVRTFGQHVAHIATFNFLWCSQAKGEANPNAGRNLEADLKTKADIVKAITDAFAYCDPVYAALTDASGAEVITITQENGRQQQQTRAGLLMLNVVHSNETYGSMVTSLRMKDISPAANAAPAR